MTCFVLALLLVLIIVCGGAAQEACFECRHKLLATSTEATCVVNAARDLQCAGSAQNLGVTPATKTYGATSATGAHAFPPRAVDFRHAKVASIVMSSVDMCILTMQGN